jgi:hypothetical protein
MQADRLYLSVARQAELAEAYGRGVCHVSRVTGDFARMLNEQPGFFVELRSEFTLDPETFLPGLLEQVRFLRCRLREFEAKLRRMR